MLQCARTLTRDNNSLRPIPPCAGFFCPSKQHLIHVNFLAIFGNLTLPPLVPLWYYGSTKCGTHYVPLGTQVARQGIDGKGIESRRATAPPPADETPPSRARSLGGGTEREKGTAAMSESRHLAVSGTARQTDAILDRRVCQKRITRRNGSRKGRA